MCPLRFILVFFSAVLAGYFAWRTVRSSPEIDDMVSDDSTAEKTSLEDKQEFNSKRMIQNGFWVFVDMASGSYLWRNLKEMKKDATLKSSRFTAIAGKIPMRSYQVVVAATRDMGIGKDGKLPWRLPCDLKFFKEITLATSDPGKQNAILMGRKTWESIPIKYRPLPGRLNVVLTRSFEIEDEENVITCGSISSALELLAEAPYCFSIDKVFVIGGGQILRETLNGPGCDAIHVTEIETSVECDTFIPSIDFSKFQPWYSSPPLVENGIRYSFVTYVHVRNSENETIAGKTGGKCNDGKSNSNRFEVKDFSFLPKMIFEKRDEYMHHTSSTK